MFKKNENYILFSLKLNIKIWKIVLDKNTNAIIIWYSICYIKQGKQLAVFLILEMHIFFVHNFRWSGSLFYYYFKVKTGLFFGAYFGSGGILNYDSITPIWNAYQV